MEKRLYAVFILLILFFCAVLLRLFFWQVLSSDILRSQAERQTLSSFIISAKRGRIFASDNSPLVINQNAYLVYAQPDKIKNKKETSVILAKELGLDIASISAKISGENLKWIPIAHKIDEELVEAIKKKNIDGIGFIEEPKRYYPEASMAAHILGFTGKNYKGENQGYFGIEGYYDEQLRGRDGVLKREADALGNPIILGKNEEIVAEDGRDLYLTIDKTVQYIVENRLKAGIEKYKASGGTVIVYEPATGAILACASFPSYNPARFEDYPSEIYANPAIASSYEPGSTFKVLVMAAAFNEGKVKPDTKYNESGSLEIGGYTIKTWNEKYHGEISLSQILEYSSNVGMVFVGNNLGENMLFKYIENLGFGSKTDVDLQEESSPNIRPRNKWYKIDYATASFGQGIAMTPLQMTRAVSAIANEGKLMKPYVVKSIQLKNGKIITTRPQVEKQIFRREVAALVSEMMAKAVENGETRYLQIHGYRIAGKTGTAQVAIAGHYDTEKTIASFVGFAPVDKPKFVMLVALKEPSASIWGSETAAPIFFEIAKELFSYYRISPS